MAATITFKFQGTSGGGSGTAARAAGAGSGFLQKYAQAGTAASALAGGEAANIASMLGAAGPWGMAIAASVSVFKSLVDTVKQADAAFLKMASAIQPYSAEVAMASANNDVKDILHQVDRAERFGASTGAFVEARGDVGRAIEKLTDEIMVPMMDILTPFLELAAPVIEDFAKLIGEMRPFFLMVIDEFIKPMLEFIKKVLEWFGFDMDKRGGYKDKNPFNLDKWLDKLGGGLPRSSFDQSFAKIPLGLTFP